MSVNIPTAFVQQYANTVALLSQQMGSRIRPFCTVGTYEGKAGQVVQQIGAVSPQKKTSRHSDKPLISTPHDVRWVYPEDYEWADLIDSEDRLRTAADFDSPYAVNGAQAIARVAIDDQIIDAYFGTNKTGENGTTSTVFDTNNIVDSAGSTALTYAKVRDGLKILQDSDVDIEMEDICCVIGPQQHDDLLGIAEAISQDYVSKPVVENGRVKYWMGINWIVSTRLPLTSDDRRCMLFARSGLHLGVWQDTKTEIAPRYDKFGTPTQVSVCGTFGATRIEEAKCVELRCDE